MINTNELRKSAIEWECFEKFTGKVVGELLDRLEEAESDALEQARLNGMGASREAALMAKLEAADMAWKICDQTVYNLTEKVIPNIRKKLEAAEKERDSLRARIEAAEELVRELQRNLSSGMWRVLREEVESWKELAAQFGRDADEAKTHIAFAKDELNHLRTKIEAMEKQEPVFWWRPCSDGAYEGPIHNSSIERVRKQSGAWSPLYLAPGAQPAPIAQDDSARKAWVRFSNAVVSGDDAPYPGMSEAFEQHFSQSFTDRDWRAESGTWAAAWKAAKRHEAQSQPRPSVPECPYPCGWQNLLEHAIKDGAYLARHINEDEPVTENARSVTMRMVLRLRDVLMAFNNAAPEAKPCP